MVADRCSTEFTQVFRENDLIGGNEFQSDSFAASRRLDHGAAPCSWTTQIPRL